MKPRGPLAYALMAAAMLEMLRDQSPHTTHSDIERREFHPWDTTNLTKAERKGKTPEEIRALRRAKWETQNMEANP